MAQDISAARARAEAGFKKPDAQAGDPVALEQEAAAHAVQRKTARLREARLAKEAQERKGAEIRAGRRRGT